MTDANRDTPATGKEPAHSSEPPAGYKIDLDWQKETCYSKVHDNGRRTQVEVEKRFERTTVRVMDTQGDEEIGTLTIGRFDNEERALTIAFEWMEANPKGLDLGVLK